MDAITPAQPVAAAPEKFGPYAMPPRPQKIEVVGVSIPFIDLMVLIMKVIVAAIPALLILMVATTMIVLWLMGLAKGLTH